MPDKDVAKQLDAFELEFKFIEHLIDSLYQLPPDHRYQQETLETLHTHRLEMRKSYDEMRTELMERLFST